uniref:Uncharacterized protein n=1 Tax=Myoviridae sp. ctwwN25 TaxID=2825209 RepID=A0A8S5PNC6_9CAUD|nr:MAG TPA: hypothetical protein [Myoviridae sp. ctwwN25]
MLGSLEELLFHNGAICCVREGGESQKEYKRCVM